MQGAAASAARKSKRKKVKHREGPAVTRPARYFTAEDEFSGQKDVVMVDVDDDEDDEEESGAGDEEGPQRKRAWSPSVPLADSSDDDDDEHGEDDALLVPAANQKQERAVLSTFSPLAGMNAFAITPDEVLALRLSHTSEGHAMALVVEQGETLALVGAYMLSVIHGSASLSGLTLRPSHVAHRVFAPRSSPVPVLQCAQASEDAQDTTIVLPERIRAVSGEGTAVVVLQRLVTGVEHLGRVCRVFEHVFQPSRWHASSSTSLDLPGVHILTHAFKDVHPFVVPASWEMALGSVCPDPTKSLDIASETPVVCIVKGPKKSGKSTFARTLLNRLLSTFQKVAFLECDLGQSEFTPGGMVALNIIEQPVFGPPFTHPTLPHLAHYIGSTSPRSSPSHYLSAIRSLLDAYRLDVQYPLLDAEEHDEREEDRRIADVIPLVVNTMGWTKGLGADLNVKIEEMVEATDVFEIEDGAWQTVDAVPPVSQRGAGAEARYHALESMSSSPSASASAQFNAIDQRNMSILSYFHAVFPLPRPLREVSATSWNTSLPLCAQYPYEVDWSVAFDRVALVGAGSEDVVNGEVERVVNGAVVGLVSWEGEGEGGLAHTTSFPNRTMPYVQGSPPPLPTTSTCHGLALIRGVSPSSPHLHVLTPLDPSVLGRCRVVVKGEMEVPVWGMLDFRSEGGEGGVAGYERGKVPYLQWGKGEGVGAERRRVRRNLMRKGQM
ncbi:hypothetical protein SERLA73DRAFT_118483 [Serpula lacrymans var. lacrymans S7.3]|uniref:Polynucleotide 5'-hydroxyl-kinase GRC3 n=2 Tax=Serpula lacrymans var. lacrymans TaxID=341189 RepID=F8PFB0_SERL3|nr:uncharacterized protein SERLADRAFT_364388 [Serpula lacrymans var. lacrymans S7.9]EGO04216.1 hypothetical protein SERLA73DRAFT_118483 [Serpula lacrymans var. lacrymans S7.3]EGO30155.1 hypothetical protein SERLADRAFT_364388 [Serpula lacrymans var. lacrymans S7.9]